MSRHFAAALGLVLTLAATGAASAASKIEEIVSPGGIKAWLVRDKTVPLLALDYAFTGGANADPADKPGLAHMVGSLLDEGAGELDALAFAARKESLGAVIDASGTLDTASVFLSAVKPRLDDSLALFADVITRPRLDDKDIERVRGRWLASIKQE